MKKLLLTSSGFDNPKISKEFLKLVDKPADEIRILFIPTASRTKEELIYVNESKKELINLGIKKENIINFNLDKKIEDNELENIGSIYVCGGNTFYLLHKVRQTGFENKIKELINKGVVYVGVSAGSVLSGPDISIAKPFDKNDIGLKDTTGLGLTDKIISPHFQSKEERIIADYEKETNKKVLRLNDEEALLILDNKTKLIK